MTPENEVATTEATLSGGSKELSEVFEAIGGLIDSAKKGENVMEVISENFGKLSSAFAGYDKIKGELAAKGQSLPTIGFYLGKMASKF